jgi:lipoprotein signal peptidase
LADVNDSSNSPRPGPPRRGLLSTFAHPQAACRHAGAIVIFLAVMAVGLAGDLWSKHVAFRSLLSDPVVAQRAEALRGEYGRGLQAEHALRLMGLHRPVFPGFRLTLSTNPGVVFGLPMPPAAVVAATMLTICLVGCFFATSRAGDWWVHLALAQILAGALGNFYDRILAAVAVPGFLAPITGQVRDFLDFSEIQVLGLRYPYIFNIADVLLVIGVAMLILHWWKAGRDEKKDRKAGRP